MSEESELLERKERVESYLDEHGIAKGRQRSGALVEILDCSAFTARRILAGNLPRAEASRKLISACEGQSEDSEAVKEQVKKVFHGVLEEKNVIIMGYVAAAVEIKAMELNIDLSSLKKSVRENLWTTVYDDATQNNGQVDQKIVNALLVNLKKESFNN